MYAASGTAALLIALIALFICTRASRIISILRRKTRATAAIKQLEVSSPTINRQPWSRLGSMVIVAIVLFVCVYFVYLRFFGCHTPLLGVCDDQDDLCVVECDGSGPAHAANLSTRLIQNRCSNVANVHIEARTQRCLFVIIGLFSSSSSVCFLCCCPCALSNRFLPWRRCSSHFFSASSVKVPCGWCLHPPCVIDNSICGSTRSLLLCAT